MLQPQPRFERIDAALLLAAFVLLVAMVIGTTAPARAQATARIEGQVSNGTAGVPGQRVAKLDVTLFQITSAGPVTRTIQTDANGRFAFDAVDSGVNTFFARVDYAGIRYFSELVPAQLAATTPLTLTVYETQTLPANFKIDGAHLILDIGERKLSGFELLQVTNPSDRAFLLPLPIPEKAAEVGFDDPRDESRAVRNADGSLSFPVLPTTTQILMGVALVTRPPTFELALTPPVPIARLSLLVSQTGDVRLASSQLTPGETFTAPSGGNYLQVSGENLRAGSRVAVTISNLPGADNSDTIRNVVLALGGLGALALLTLPFRRGRREQDSEMVALADERLARLQAIAALDDAFEAGQIEEEEYRMRRAELKAELMRENL